MEYNSQKDLLIMPEYGRNVQLLVQYAKHIEEPDYRQAFVEKVVDLMYQMNPQNKNVEDYRMKLWLHVFHIADYDIDVMPPNGEIPEPGNVRKIPDRVPYPTGSARFRHYGANVQTLIKKALAMEEGPKRDGFIDVIGSYMKLAYRTWNREHFVSDEVILNDLKSLSGGKLEIKSDVSLDNLASSNSNLANNNNNNSPRRRQKRANSGGYSNNGGRGNNGRGGRNNGGGKKYYRK